MRVHSKALVKSLDDFLWVRRLIAIAAVTVLNRAHLIDDKEAIDVLYNKSIQILSEIVRGW